MTIYGNASSKHHSDIRNWAGLAAFYGTLLLISWPIWIDEAKGSLSSILLALLAGYAPTLSGLAFTFLMDGKGGLRQLFARFSGGKVGWKWIAFSLLGPGLIFLTALGIYRLAGGDCPSWIDPAHVIRGSGELFLAPLVFAYVFGLSALGEELGWRGFALPRLIDRLGGLRASLVLGLGWALWHLPLFWIPGDFHQRLPLAWFVLQVVASTFIYTWLYRHTRGSLLIACLFHAAGNSAIGILPVLPLDAGGSTAPLWLALAGMWGIVGCILLLDRRAYW